FSRFERSHAEAEQHAQCLDDRSHTFLLKNSRAKPYCAPAQGSRRRDECLRLACECGAFRRERAEAPGKMRGSLCITSNRPLGSVASRPWFRQAAPCSMSLAA